MSAYDEVADWPIMNCETCARPFGQEAPYMRSCPVCFKEANGYKLLKGDLAVARLQLALEQERQAKGNPNIDEELYDSLRRENASLKETVQRLQADLRAAHRSRRPAVGGTSIPPKRVLQLIKLCHPDKHKDSPEATEVTQWITAQMTKAKP